MLGMIVIPSFPTAKHIQQGSDLPKTVYFLKAERKSHTLKNTSQSIQPLNSAVGEAKQDSTCSRHGLLIHDWICSCLIRLVDLQTIGEGLFWLMCHHQLWVMSWQMSWDLKIMIRIDCVIWSSLLFCGVCCYPEHDQERLIRERDEEYCTLALFLKARIWLAVHTESTPVYSCSLRAAVGWGASNIHTWWIQGKTTITYLEI